MRFLGIDPGVARIGFAIIEKKDSKLKIIDSGCIEPKAKDRAKRLEIIFNRISDIIKREKPDIVGVESLYFFKNQKTAFEVGEARGVIILASEILGKKVLAPTPLQVKQALTGYGRAQKMQVQEMIKRIFGLKKIPKPDDLADALAVAFWLASTNR